MEAPAVEIPEFEDVRVAASKETSLQRLKRVASQITYKKGWTGQVDESHGAYRFCVGFDAEDANNGASFRGSSRIVQIRFFAEDYLKLLDDHYLVRELYRTFQELEMHECSEWFKYKGVAVFNEHDFTEKARI
jgi:hypothetical protein